MGKFILSAEHEQELRAAHRSAVKAKNARAAYKINAIILLGTGWSVQETSEALLFDEDTLSSYVKKYQENDIDGLLETFYKGSSKKLSVEQIKILCEELDCTVHLTTKSVCQFVKQEFQITYTIGGMTDLLHNLGYSYKKPKLSPSNPDEDAQEMFLQFYEHYMANKPANEEVVFLDAVHPVHNSMPAYGWFKKGEARELKSNTGRGRLNIHGAMNAETFETTILASEENVDASSTIDLLKSLETVYPKAKVIHVILDNAKYHYSRPVLEYVLHSRINLVFLPTYSPELNLIERLWRVFKKHVLYNKFYQTYSEFKKSCMNFFKKQSDYIDEISEIMGDGLEALL